MEVHIEIKTDLYIDVHSLRNNRQAPYSRSEESFQTALVNWGSDSLFCCDKHAWMLCLALFHISLQGILTDATQMENLGQIAVFHSSKQLFTEQSDLR